MKLEWVEHFQTSTICLCWVAFNDMYVGVTEQPQAKDDVTLHMLVQGN